MRRELTGQCILITGAGSGIGAATARACAQRGMDVVLNGRRRDRLDLVADDVRGAGRRAHVIAADVSDPGASDELLRSALGAMERLDVVFSNAGYGMRRAVIDETVEDRRRLFEVNYFASVELLQLAAQLFLSRATEGHLLMCSSCLSKFSTPLHSSYSASKAAQNAVCQSMRLELEPHRIAVSSVHPITTTTEFFDASALRDGRQAPAPERPSFFVHTPERVARAIVKCLERPRPEVWTSTTMRGIAGLTTFFPALGDTLIRWQLQRRSGRALDEDRRHESRPAPD